MTKPLFMARLAGSQEAMGAQHGRMVAEDARELVEFYRTMPERALVGGVPGLAGRVANLAARGVATAWQASLSRSRPDDLAARSRAYIEAATGSADRIALYTLATMDSMQNCVSLVARGGLGPFAGMQPEGDEVYRPDLVATTRAGVAEARGDERGAPATRGGMRSAASARGDEPSATGDRGGDPGATGERGGLARLLQRIPWLARLATRAASTAAPACTSVIAWGDATEDGELLFARNFDFPGVGVWDAAPAFVVNAPTGGQRYAFFARRGADTAVVTVVNEAGLVIAPHTRWHVGAAFTGAMIIDVIHDIARRAETLDDAIRIARERPISSTWGIAIGSAREKSGIVIEVAGPAVEVVRPDQGASFLVCANRYRTPSLQAGQVAASRAWAQHSEKRERRMRQLVQTRTSPLTAEQLARFLGDREDVEAPGRKRHLGAIIAQPTNVHCAVIAPAHLRALVGVDRAPCCEGRWADVTWTWDGPTGSWELGSAPGTSGFSARERTDVAPPHDAATLHMHEATRVYEGSHDLLAARSSLDRAIAGDPTDPSLRLAAAWLALEDDDSASAVAHVQTGLAHETGSHRRAQLLLWGARAAAAGDRVLAQQWQDELARLTGPHVGPLQAMARDPHGRPRVNLVMVDAY